MKLFLQCCVVALVGGVGLGAVLGYYEARPWAFSLDEGRTAQVAVDAELLGVPTAGVEETTFHFGKMQRGARRRHTFEVSSAGAAPLEVKFVSSTCKCTAVEMNGNEVEVGDVIQVDPGVIGQITLQWEAKDPSGPFRHGASFQTNDPSLSRLSLEVEGEIVESTLLSQPTLHYGSVQAGTPATETLYVMSSLDPEVEILDHQIIGDERLEEWLTIRVEPAEKHELTNPQAISGAKVIADLDAGGAVGSVHGALVLTTSMEQAPELVVPINGLVRGDVSVFGKGYDRNTGRLKLENVKSSEGARVELMINVRGEHAKATEIKVDQVDPPALKASIGAPRALSESLMSFPLVVEAPKGSSPIVRTGDDEGKIVLTSTHPTAKEIRIRVRLIILP